MTGVLRKKSTSPATLNDFEKYTTYERTAYIKVDAF